MTREQSFLAPRLAAWARLQPHRVALTGGPSDVVDYASLSASSGEMAAIWARHGLGEHAPVLICLPHDTALAVCLTSLLAAGVPGIVAGSTELPALMERLPFHALLTTEAIAKTALAKAPEGVGVAARVGRNRHEDDILLFPLSRRSSVPHAEPCGFAWSLLTSGSTGEPKAVKLSEENLRDRTLGEIQLFRIMERDHLLNILPFSHDLGLNQLLSSLAAGASLELSRASMPMDLAEQLKTGAFSGVTGLPSIWSHFLQIAARTRVTMPFVGFLTVSGGSLPSEELSRLSDVFPGARIIKTYGQTETFRTFAEDRPDKIAQDSCGRALPGVRALVVDDSTWDSSSQSLRPCSPGEVGQLVHFGEGAMSGYWLDEDLSARKMLAGSEPGVLTGDYFRVLADGEYQFAGRRDDLVKRMGHRFYLTEIEATLRRSGLAGDACVILVAGSNRWGALGDRLVAFVEPREAKPGLSSELRRFCRDTLASYKIPDEIRILDRMPLTASRKPDRKGLTATFASSDSAPQVGSKGESE